MATGYYVTGTDTGVGKTLASACLVHALRSRGVRATGMKPVASGCERRADGAWRCGDALELQDATGDPRPDYALVNPYALPAPTAPQIAAAEAGIRVELAPIVAAFRTLAISYEAIVVEGVGGWMAPLADDFEQAALARALDLPVILVVGLRLGCLNHARLSKRAILDDGLRLAGWIGNAVDADAPDAAAYRALLERELRSTCLGWLPHAPDGRAEALHPYLQGFPLR
jgi:dethiobiotin synthetase